MAFAVQSLLSPVELAVERLQPLFGGASLGEISRESARLPNLFDAFGFEVRLAKGEDGVDLGLRLDARSGGYERLWRASAAHALPDHPAWKRVGDLARGWIGRRDEPVPQCVFFEMDTSRPRVGGRGPSIFLHHVTRPTSPDSVSRFERICRADTGVVPAAAQSFRLGACIGALGEDGALLDVGLMLDRPDESLRVHVSTSPEGVETFLGAVDLAHRSKDVLDLARRYGRDAAGNRLDGLELQFEIMGATDRRIGVEYGFPLHPGVDRLRHLDALLGRLVEDGCCSLEKRLALLDWSARDADGVEFGVSHVKLVQQPGVGLRAKAYVYVRENRTWAA